MHANVSFAAFLSIIPSAVIAVRFYFDHEISSIICTIEPYGVKISGRFAWDIVLLGTTTILLGLLGSLQPTGSSHRHHCTQSHCYTTLSSL